MWRASLAMAVNGLKLLYRLDRSVVVVRPSEFKPRNFPENDREGTKSGIVPASVLSLLCEWHLHKFAAAAASVVRSDAFLVIVGMADDVSPWVKCSNGYLP